MYKKILVAVLITGMLLGCKTSPAPRSDTVQDKGQPPVILDHFAAEAIRPGATWRVYLEATDPDGDMEYIITEIFQAGGGYYPVDFTKLRGENTRSFAGYLFLNTPSDQDLVFDQFTIKIFVRDRQKNRSQPIELPLAFKPVPQEQPPDKWQAAANHRLGVIMVEIRSTEKINQASGEPSLGFPQYSQK
jgi:hypothetical protein